MCGLVLQGLREGKSFFLPNWVSKMQDNQPQISFSWTHTLFFCAVRKCLQSFSSTSEAKRAAVPTEITFCECCWHGPLPIGRRTATHIINRAGSNHQDQGMKAVSGREKRAADICDSRRRLERSSRISSGIHKRTVPHASILWAETHGFKQTALSSHSLKERGTESDKETDRKRQAGGKGELWER